MMKRLMIFVSAMLCLGCVKGTDVSVLFGTDVAVTEGSQVYYQQEIIGEVNRVSQENSDTRVHMSLDSEKLGELKKGSAALLVKRDGETNIELFNYRTGEQSLSDGDELVALHNTMEYVAWQTGETVDFAQDTLTDMTASLRNFLQSEEWLKQKQEMQQELQRLGSDVQIAISEMQKEYEALIQEMETQSEKSRKQAEKRYQELATALKQQIAELLKSGEEVLADSLQQFLDSLNQLMQRYSELQKQDKNSETAA